MRYELSDPRSVVTGRILSLVLWGGAAILTALLLLRFGMRALGVRSDLSVPTFVYDVTASLVHPFYRFFPLPAPYGARFDTPVTEIASLGAACAVMLVAAAIYVAGLLLFARGK